MNIFPSLYSLSIPITLSVQLLTPVVTAELQELKGAMPLPVQVSLSEGMVRPSEWHLLFGIRKASKPKIFASNHSKITKAGGWYIFQLLKLIFKMKVT